MSNENNSLADSGSGKSDSGKCAEEFTLILTEPELTALWSLLTVAELRKDPRKVRNPVDAKLDQAMVSALAKVQRLMETPAK